MTEQEVFIAANKALLNVVKQIKADQWEMVMPDDFPTFQPKPVTLRQVVNGHAYDEAWTPDMLAGKTMNEVGAEAFKGDLLGDDPNANLAELVESASSAARGFMELNQTVHCSFGDFPASEYLKQITSYHAFHAYDIAKAIGVDAAMPDDLVKGLWWELEPIADEWRSYGVFGPKVEVPESAPLQDRLLGLVGRQP